MRAAARAYLRDLDTDQPRPVSAAAWLATMSQTTEIEKREGVQVENPRTGELQDVAVDPMPAAWTGHIDVPVHINARLVTDLTSREIHCLVTTAAPMATIDTLGSNSVVVARRAVGTSTAVGFNTPIALWSMSPGSAVDVYPWLASALAAVERGAYRAAYGDLYRGLDELFLGARWQEVTAILEEICSVEHPAEFAIGAMRFSSDAKAHIERWDKILATLRETTAEQGLNVAEVLRGLIDED